VQKQEEIAFGILSLAKAHGNRGKGKINGSGTDGKRGSVDL
jgi:hypothetical protein